MLKVAIIGSGFGQYGLFPAFRSVKNCEVVAICGEKRKQLIDYCKSVDFGNIYSDWRLLLKNEDLDAVAIAVTPRGQYEIAKFAIIKGLHIFAEKPLALNVLQAKELFTLAKKNKITHGIDFLFSEIAEWQKAKELIDNKKFGKLVHLSVNWDFLGYHIKHKKPSWKTEVAEGGGALSFYFSHGLYYLEHFAGKISAIKSLFTYTKEGLGDAETGVDMLLKFENGATGHAHVNCNSVGLTRHQVMFQCENGTIILENEDNFTDNFNIKTWDRGGLKKVVVKKDKSQKNEDERVKIVKKLAARFVSACERNKPTFPSFEDGLRVQELIETIRSQKIN